MLTFDIGGTYWDGDGDAWPVNSEGMIATNVDMVLSGLLLRALNVVSPTDTFTMEGAWLRAGREDGDETITGATLYLKDDKHGDFAQVVATIL